MVSVGKAAAQMPRGAVLGREALGFGRGQGMVIDKSAGALRDLPLGLTGLTGGHPVPTVTAALRAARSRMAQTR